MVCPSGPAADSEAQNVSSEDRGEDTAGAEAPDLTGADRDVSVTGGATTPMAEAPGTEASGGGSPAGEGVQAGVVETPATGEIAVTGPPTAQVPPFPTSPVPPIPPIDPGAAGAPPMAPPMAPPWTVPVAGAYWAGHGGHGGGTVPPYPPPQYPYGYGAPHHPYAYGAPQHPYAPAPTRQRKPMGSWGVAAIVTAVVVVASAATGAAVEYAVNNANAGSQAGNVIPTPGGSGSGSGSGSSNAPAGVNTSAIAAQVDPGLVDITTTLAEGGAAAGTGMVLTSDGLVLTNNHVIENATTVNAQVGGTGQTYSATVLGYSVTDDVALLQLKDASGLKTVTTGNSANLSVGSPIVAIGNALGKGGTPTAVAGSITALDQTITAGDSGTLTETLHGLIQTNAPIQPGDSGGPLVDTSGHVIGMDTAAAIDNSGGFGVEGGTSEGYAIGINQALAIANDIKAGNASSTVQIGPRALLGVAVSDGSSSGGAFGGLGGGSGVAGAYVERVESGSPADTAGIGAGDTITSVGGTTIGSAQDLSNALLNYKPGDTVTVVWVDAQGTSHTASVVLTTGPPA